MAIVIRSMDTGQEREIKNNLISCGPVHWFPDGQSLLTAAARDRTRRQVDYVRIDVRTGETSVLLRSAGGRESYRPDPSPDGKTIFFTRTQGDTDRRTTVLAYEIETGQERELFRLAKGRLTSSVLVSPDGHQLAFVEWEGSSVRSVKIVPSAGGEPRELLKAQDREVIPGNEALAWAKDGQYLFVSKMTFPGGVSEILRVPVVGGEVQRTGITMKQIFLGDAHTDGRRIAFYAGPMRETVQEVWAMENFLPAVEAGR